MKHKTTALILNTPTVNNRIYTTEVIEKALINFRKKIDSDIAFGELAPNIQGFEDRSFNYSKVESAGISHLVTEIVIIDNELVVEIETLPVRWGQFLSKLIKEDKVALRPVGIGEIENIDGKDYIKDGYEIVSFMFYDKEDVQ